MNYNEKVLLKTISIYFLEGGKDGNFHKSWVNDWSDSDINQFDGELIDYCAEVDWDYPDYFFLNVPISITYKFLLWKLTQKNY